ncbi:MAG TPA: hypothetical protein VGM51_04115 [Armatimonadota bacterium]
MNNNEAITKAISTTTISTGVLNPDQAQAFVQQVFEATPMLTAARRVLMGARKMNVDKIGVGSRLLRKRPEGTTVAGMATLAAAQVQLDAVNLSLPWEITEDAIRFNMEGERFEETVISLMTRQVGVDLNDLAWNGNTVAPSLTTLSAALSSSATSISVASTAGYPESGVLEIDSERIFYASRSTGSFGSLIRGFDGTVAANHSNSATVGMATDWLTIALNGWLKQSSTTAHVIEGSTISGGAMDKGQFKAAIAAMPTKYLTTASANGLRWIMHPRTAFAFYDSLVDHVASSGDLILLGAGGKAPYGYPILEDPAVPIGALVFTDPRNLIIGLATDVRVSRDVGSKDVISRGVRYYQIDLAADVKIEEADAMVVTTGITV